MSAITNFKESVISTFQERPKTTFALILGIGMTVAGVALLATVSTVAGAALLTIGMTFCLVSGLLLNSPECPDYSADYLPTNPIPNTPSDAKAILQAGAVQLNFNPEDSE